MLKKSRIEGFFRVSAHPKPLLTSSTNKKSHTCDFFVPERGGRYTTSIGFPFAYRITCSQIWENLFESSHASKEVCLLPAQIKTGKSQSYFVPERGLEPPSLARRDFESRVYTIPPLRHYNFLRNSFPVPDFRYFSLILASTLLLHVSV